MRSVTTRSFRDAFRGLPEEIRERARKAYRLYRRTPSHPSLHFKIVNPRDSLCSVRVSLGYRALGRLDGNVIVWFWIGPHDEYDKRL